MIAGVRAFVNERPVDLPDGATVGDAVRAVDAALADRLAEGAAFATDGRGIEMAADRVLRPGAIVRVVVSARRSATGPEGADADS